MTTATITQEIASFNDVNGRVHEFLARFKQLNELFGKTDGLTEPLEHSAGAIGLDGQVRLVLNMPQGFRVKTYKGDGSAINALHLQGPYDGFLTRDTYDRERPFEAHQLLGKIETDNDYNVASSLKLTGHMPDSFGLPSDRTMRSVSIAEPEQLGDYVLFLARDDRYT